MRYRLRRHLRFVPRVIVVLVLGFVMGRGVPALAQEGIVLRVTPRVGVIDVGEALYGRSITNGDNVFTSSGRVSRGKSIGLAVDVGSVSRGFWVRLSADRSLSIHTDVGLGRRKRPGSNRLTVGPSSDNIRDIQTSVTEFGLDLVLPLRFELGPLHPYVSAGLGVTRYRFSVPDVSFDLHREWSLPESGSASSGRIGGGFELDALGRAWTVTILDSISQYFDVTQHHVMASIGFTMGR